MIQFSSGSEIELCFETEVEGLYENDTAAGDIDDYLLFGPSTGRIILAPSSLLDEDDEGAVQDILDLVEEEAFDEEFGEGDESLDSDDDSESSSKDSRVKWVEEKD